MAKVVWIAGIEYVSGALCKANKKSPHSHAKMLLATHRVAPTTNSDCNRIYLRKTTKRTTPLSNDEIIARNRFKAVAQAVAVRAKDLSKITADTAAFLAQKDTPGGKKTIKSYLWSLELAAYDQAHDSDD